MTAGRAPRVRGRAGSHPAQAITIGFALVAVAGTALLWLPAASQGSGSASFMTALFTSVSATSVTGLTVVDTATYWSPFGHLVLLVLMQVGGLGILTSASLLLLLVSRRLGLRRLLIAQADTNALDLGDVRRVVVGVVAVSAVVEGLTTLAFATRLWLGYGRDLPDALWEGVFHAVSAFNNAGFALYSDSFASFVGDAWFLVPAGVAIFAGSLGVPVWLELRRLRRSPARWALHVKLTLVTSAILVVLGGVLLTALEWGNDETLGGLAWPVKLLNGFFTSVVTRSAGFSTFDFANLDPDSLFVMDVLMFIGGGSGSVAGGIKVATLAVLVMVVWAEILGEPDVSAFGRTVPPSAIRQAFSVTVLSAALVAFGTLGLAATNDIEFSHLLFEAVSAFGTAGLSAGATPLLDATGRTIIIALMFIGRIGPVALGAALVLRERPRLYDYPEERPLIG